jgi:hypothetical protein
MQFIQKKTENIVLSGNLISAIIVCEVSGLATAAG